MAKITLNSVLSGFLSVVGYNTNNTLIAAAIENTLSRDGTSPNQMTANLDMNSNGILNISTINGVAASLVTDLAAAVTAAQLAETHAETAEVNAELAETNAAASEAAAAASAAAALVSENNAAASYDAFDDRYLGAKAVAPTLDNDGNAILTGAFYWNTVSSVLFVWNGAAWIDPVSGTTAGSISNTPAGNIAATNVQTAINELDTEKAALSGAAFTGAISSTTITGSSIVKGNSSTGTTISSAIVGLASTSGTGVYGSSATGDAIVGVTGTSGYGVYGTSSTGAGVYGAAPGGKGVSGLSTTDAGIYGVSTSYAGVYGTSSTGDGVTGINSGGTGRGVAGFSTTASAIYGSSTLGYGVWGISAANYGIVAQGDATSPTYSAFRIVPQDTQPTTGSVGDLYVNSGTGKLWICTVTGTPGTWAIVGTQA